MTAPQTERRQNADTDRYFNALFDAVPRFVVPGEAAFSDLDNEMLIATLGAGIGVSLHDSELHFGALAYVSLTKQVLDVFPYFKDASDDMLKDAFTPLNDAIAQMKQHGAGKNRIYVRLVGGANLTKITPDAGTKNAVFVKEYLSRQGLSVLNEDIGGPFIRRLHFFPSTGRAVRMVLKRQSDTDYVEQLESAYHQNI